MSLILTSIFNVLIEDHDFQQTMLEHIEQLVNDVDPMIRNNADYFLEQSQSILKRNFECTQADVFRLYVPTTDFSEVELSFPSSSSSTSSSSGSSKFSSYPSMHLIDIGGLRSERKRWAGLGISEVKSVLFVVSLSEYDQVLQEDQTSNRMQESIALFSEALNMRWCYGAQFILVLTKYDVLQRKIRASPSKAPIPSSSFASSSSGSSSTTYSQLEINRVDEVVADIVEQYQQIFYQSTGGFAGKLWAVIADPFDPSSILPPLALLLKRSESSSSSSSSSASSSCSSSASQASSSAVYATIIHKVLRLQAARGSWDLTDEFLALLRVTRAFIQPLTISVTMVLQQNQEEGSGRGVAITDVVSVVGTLVALSYLDVTSRR
jgi:CCR4-NOT transcriptional regulation complex NOT5 subunit